MRNEMLVIPILMQILYLGWFIGLRLILLRNVILQRYYYDATLTTFLFVHVHLTASNKGELTNQNAAYWIIALEFLFFAVNKYDSLQFNFFSRLLTKGNTIFHFHHVIQISVMKFLSSFLNTENVNLLFNSRNFMIVPIYQLVLVYL